MPIVYYGGVEGSGKTMMMTRDLWYHHRCGGKIYAFPGYELLNTKGNVVSKLLMPEQVINLMVSEEVGYAIAIDEITNFMNKHHWQDQIVDLFTFGVAAQRRKKSMAILATGPIFEDAPKVLRNMFHEVVHLEDWHWKNRAIPPGVQSRFYRQDMRGMLSGQIGKCTRPRLFNTKRYWKHANTFSPVDPRYQLRRVRVLRKETLVDEDGNIIESPENTAAMVEEYGKKLVPRDINSKGVLIPKIFRVICDLVQEGYQTMSLSELGQKIRSETGIRSTDNIIAREYLQDLNCVRINNKNEKAIYALPELAGE